jgi:hypothetical protein
LSVNSIPLFPVKIKAPRFSRAFAGRIGVYLKILFVISQKPPHKNRRCLGFSDGN